MAAMIIMITAMRPGTIMLALSSASLYQTRLRTSTGAGTVVWPSTACDEYAATMAAA